MADTLTANYSFVKPEIGASANTWGLKTNNNWDSLDTIMKAVSDVANNGVVNTKAWLKQASPIGTILAWSGSIASIPAGFHLCDGTNGTPNLQDKFILGTGTLSGPVGTTGGSFNHAHGGATQGHSLTAAENGPHNHSLNDPGHAHNYADPGHSHGLSDPGHNHSFTASTGAIGSGPFSSGTPYANSNNNFTGVSYTGITMFANYTGIVIQAAATGMSVVSNGSGTAHTHPIASDSNTPPYMSLAYIMRISYPWDP